MIVANVKTATSHGQRQGLHRISRICQDDWATNWKENENLTDFVHMAVDNYLKESITSLDGSYSSTTWSCMGHLEIFGSLVGCSFEILPIV